MSWLIDLPNLAATERLAAALAPLVGVGDVIALTGDLGTGKTAFARALVNARLGPLEVPSPTFNLVLTYEGDDGIPVWHFDLYRIEDLDEIFELGIEEAFATAISLIEWPERLGEFLPSNRLRLRFEIVENDARRASLDAPSSWMGRLHKLARAQHWRELP